MTTEGFPAGLHGTEGEIPQGEGRVRRSKAVVGLALALVFSGAPVASPALAEKPPWAGGTGAEKHGGKGQAPQGQGKGPEKATSAEKSGLSVKASQYFGAETRIAIHGYYGEQFRSGPCPPGLAKKGNGCMPPGQARKWEIGRPLPRDVIYYDLPPQVLVQLGPAPSGHRFVRVATDILMIAIGTGMIVDAIEDIGRQLDR